MSLVELKAKVMGYPKVELGKIISVKGFSSPIDGTYVVAGIRHCCDFQKGIYNTEIKMRANRFEPQKSLDSYVVPSNLRFASYLG